MSGPTGPNRRRIAGETPASGGAAKKPSVRKVPKTPRVAKPASAPASVVVKKRAFGRQAPPDDRAPRFTKLRTTPLWILFTGAVAAASLAAGLVLSTMALLESDSGASSVDDRRTAAAAAGSASETIFSFTYDTLDEHLVESKALMTPAFSEEFDEIAPSLTELAPQRQVQVEAVTRNTALVECGEECSANQVTALVFVDQVRLVGGDDEPTVFANRIEVTMKKSDGQWLVDDIRAL